MPFKSCQLISASSNLTTFSLQLLQYWSLRFLSIIYLATQLIIVVVPIHLLTGILQAVDKVIN